MALDSLTLTIDAGVIGLVGANGAGKSTLIKILLGPAPADRGLGHVLGLDVRTQGTDLRQFVGYMPEHDCLPPDVSARPTSSRTWRRSTACPRAAARERTAEVLRHVGLFEERYRADRRLLHRHEAAREARPGAGARPAAVLLDEPTNGLDPAGRDEMLDLVRRIGSEFGIAIVMSSHLLGEIERVCDHLVVIDGGRLVRSDAIAQLHDARCRCSPLEVDGEPGRARRAPSAGAGLQVGDDGQLVLIGLRHGSLTTLFATRSRTSDVGLCAWSNGATRLEDLFRADEDGDRPMMSSRSGSTAPAASTTSATVATRRAAAGPAARSSSLSSTA